VADAPDLAVCIHADPVGRDVQAFFGGTAAYCRALGITRGGIAERPRSIVRMATAATFAEQRACPSSDLGRNGMTLTERVASA